MTSYDPDVRRDTPLALKLKAQIRRSGPIPVAAYMRACLHDPEHGYYRKMPAIGAGGDFVTAPEISQVFGELIGLWCAVVWQQMGSPETVHLVELGPGRGTMMRDALRATRVVPGFAQAVRVHLVESNAQLREAQRQVLSHILPTWHDDLTSLPEGAMIVLGNEFLDTCSIQQYEFMDSGMFVRGVGTFQDQLAFVHLADLSKARDPQLFETCPWIKPGDVVERQDFAALLPLARRSVGQLTAGLLIDYGHSSPIAGETLQAVRHHVPEHPLTSPGEADLTAQVDFSEVRHSFETWGMAVDGPVTQAAFLGALGIVERASRLMAANPGRAAEIEAGVARLIAPNAMGSRFKAIGIRSPQLPPLPGF